MSNLLEKYQTDMELRNFSPQHPPPLSQPRQTLRRVLPKAPGKDSARPRSASSSITPSTAETSAVPSSTPPTAPSVSSTRPPWTGLGTSSTSPAPKRRNACPVALAREEIARLLRPLDNLKHRAILTTTYAAGLRVSEVARLKVADIDSSNMQIHVRQGKGRVDRYSLLSPVNLELLRLYWAQYRPKDWLFPGALPANPWPSRSIQGIFHDAKDQSGNHKSRPPSIPSATASPRIFWNPASTSSTSSSSWATRISGPPASTCIWCAWTY